MLAKELREKRAKLIKDAQAILLNDAATAEDITKANGMMDESDALMARIASVERAGTLSAEIDAAVRADAGRNPGRGGAVIAFDQAREIHLSAALTRGGAVLADLDRDERDYYTASLAREKRILRALALGGVGALSEDDRAHYASRFGNVAPEFRAAGNISDDTAGGYTVAPLFETDMLIAMKLQGGMREASRGITTSTGASLPWPTLDDTAQVATIVGTENTQITEDTGLTFGRQSLGAFTYKSGTLPVSLQLLQDSAFDFDSLIRNAMAGRFVRGQNAHFTTGTGSGQPFGVVPKAVLGKTGASGQTATIIYDDLVDTESSVDPVYRKGAIWMMHDSTRKVLRKLKDTQGHPLWQPSLVAGTPDTLLTYPIVLNQDMATPAASAKTILFGNFQNYIVRDTLGMQVLVLKERFADSLQVAWLAFMRSDGNLISAASPIKYFIQAAS